MTENKGDLINREALKEDFKERNIWNPEIISAIDNAPTVELDRTQGEWEFYAESSDDTSMAYYKCSVCGRLVIAERKVFTDVTLLENYPFCHCGADMTGKINTKSALMNSINYGFAEEDD